jgi:hypothetical protein
MFYDDASVDHFKELVEALRQQGVTAFMGAGLSAPHLPAWSELHGRLQSEAGLDFREFSAAAAPVDFMSFRMSLGNDRYLALLKELFGRPPAEIPRAYRLIDDTAGFDTLITTNFDEFLASTAMSTQSRPDIVAYPNLRVGYRYVYLHGRASTATEASHLVLCDDDYDHAYDSTYGNALVVLRGYLLGEIVFVGCSMSDPDPMNVVNSVLRWRRRQDKSPTTLRPKPFVILPAHKPESSTQTLEAYIATETERMVDRGLRPIWYQHDTTHSQLIVLLEQLRHEATPAIHEPVLLERAAELEAMIQSSSPGDTSRLIDLVKSSPVLTRHFFATATSTALYEAVRDAGLITIVAEPQELPGGVYRSTPWAAAPYVRSISAERPEAVVETLVALRETKNWIAKNALAEMTLELPPALLSEALPVLFDWLHAEFESVSLVADYLVQHVGRLSADREFGLALDVLGALIEPRGPSDTDQLTVKDYELERLVGPLETLASQAPAETYAVFREAIAILLERPDQGYLFWRPAIEDHQQNSTHFNQGSSFLTTGARDSLNAWLRADPDSASKEVTLLLESQHDLLIRLGTHALTVNPEAIDRFDVAGLIERSFFNPSLFHEIARLVHLRFGDLPEAVRELIHRMIREGPPIRDGESSDSHSQRVDSWRHSYLGVLAEDDRNEEEREWVTALHREWGEPAEKFFLVYSRSGWVASEREIAAIPDVQQNGVAALWETLSRDPGSWPGTREQVARVPDLMLDLAPRIRAEDLPHIFPFIDAYIELVKAGRAFDWTPLVALAERLDGVNPDADSTFAWLFRQGLGTRKAGVPDDLLDRAFKICCNILARRSTPIEVGIEKDREWSFHQLNHPAGQAADALLFYVWRRGLIAGDNRRVPPLVEPLLEEALTDSWGGSELRYAVGQGLRTLEWVEPGWLGTNYQRLIPPGQSSFAINAKRAFLSGNLLDKQVSNGILRTLAPLYAEALPDTATETRLYLDRREHWSVNSLVEFIALGWLWDVDGYADDELMGELLQYGSDSALSHLAGFLHAHWSNVEADLKAQTWERIDGHWAKRVDAWRDEGINRKSHELMSFTRWLPDVPAALGDVESRLCVMIDHMALGFGMETLVEFVTSRTGEAPDIAVKLLERVVERWSGDPEFYWSGRKLEPALDAVIGSLGKHHVGVARIVSRLFETGFADFRSKLA